MTYDSEVLADSPAAAYAFDELTGSQVTDLTGNGRHAIYEEPTRTGYYYDNWPAPTYESDSILTRGVPGIDQSDPTQTSIDIGGYGSSGYPVGGYITLPSMPTSTYFSVEMVISYTNSDFSFGGYPRRPQDYEAVWQLHTNGVQAMVDIWGHPYTHGVITYQSYFKNFLVPSWTSSIPYAPQFMHLAFTVEDEPAFTDTGRLRVYRNGALIGNDTYSQVAVSPNTARAGHNTSEYFSGEMSLHGFNARVHKFAYYTGTLSAARVTAHYGQLGSRIGLDSEVFGGFAPPSTKVWTQTASLNTPVIMQEPATPSPIARWTGEALLSIPIELQSATPTSTLSRFTSSSALEGDLVGLVESTVTPRVNITAHSGFAIVPAGMTMTVLDPDQRRSPTTLTVALSGAIPDDYVSFTVNGGTPRLVQADWSGNVPLVNIDVPSSVGVGSHTVEASSGTGVYARVAESPFTIELVPEPQFFPAPDEVAVDVPAAVQPTGRKWVFQDLMPGGLGSWVLPRNPSQSTLPVVRRVLEPTHTTARTGVHHIFESRTDVTEWQFGGLVCTQEEQEQLEAFAALNRRFYIIDHLNRAWVATISNLETVPRLRTLIGLAGETAELSDWVADNTVTATVYGSTWYTPT